MAGHRKPKYREKLETFISERRNKIDKEGLPHQELINAWMVFSQKEHDPRALVGLVSSKFNISARQVEQVVRNAKLIKCAQELRQEVKKEVLEEKIPILKEIVGHTLINIRDYLVTLSQNQEKKEKLNVRDIKDLSLIAKDLNELLRLELGQSTQNVEVVEYSYKNVQVVLQDIKDLKNIDPVFEYPELPLPKEEVLQKEFGLPSLEEPEPIKEEDEIDEQEEKEEDKEEEGEIEGDRKDSIP